MAASELSPTRLPGFVLPADLEIWKDESDAGEASPIPAMVEPQADDAGRYPQLALTAGGTPDTEGLEISVRSVNSGQIASGAGHVWKRATDDKWHGWKAPVGFVGFAPVAVDTLVGTYPRKTRPHAIGFQSGKEVVVYGHRLLSSSSRSVVARCWNPTTEAYTTVTVASGLAGSYDPTPCLLLVPAHQGPARVTDDDGILLCLYVYVDTSGSGEDMANLRVAASRDRGLTWSTYAEDVLPESFEVSGASAYSIERIRAVHFLGEITLVLSFTHPTNGQSLRQYVSPDLSARYIVRGTDHYPNVTSPDLLVARDKIRIAWRNASNGPVYTAIAAPWQVIRWDGATTINVDITDDLALALIDDERHLYVFAVENSSYKLGVTARVDLMTGEAEVLSAAASVMWYWDGLDPSTEYPTDFCATGYRGQARIYTFLESSGTTYDYQLWRIDVGAQSTITWPLKEGVRLLDNVVTWTKHWTAHVLPSAVGYTHVGGGSTSITTTAGWLRLTTSAAQSYYTINITPTPAVTEEIWARGVVKQIVGGGVSGRGLAVRVRLAGATWGYEVELRFEDDRIRLRDTNGLTPADLTTVDAPVSSGVEWMIAIGADKASAWYRVLTSPETQTWIAIGEDQDIGDDGGTGGGFGGTSLFQPGNLATDTVTSEWRDWSFVAGSDLGIATLKSGQTNPDELWPIPYTAGVRYMGSGVKTAALGGPALIGDEYLIRQDARYPYRLLLGRPAPGSDVLVRGGDAPTPQCRWIGTVDPSTLGGGSTAGVAVRVVGSGARRWLRGAVAAHIERPNFGYCKLRAHNGTSWSTLATWDWRVTDLPFLRQGAAVYPDPSGTFTNRPRLSFDELKYGYFDDGNSKIRPIIGNTGGRFSEQGIGPIPTIFLDPDSLDGTEDTAGVGAFWYPRATIIILIPSTSAYEGFQLYWDAAQTVYQEPLEASQRLKAGSLDIGEVVLPGDLFDWGWTYGTKTGSEYTELENGILVTSTPKGPRRSISLPFTSVYRTSGVREDDYSLYAKISATSGHPVVNEQGDLDDLLAYVIGTIGPQWPIVWIPRVERTTSPQTYLGFQAGLRGQVVTGEWVAKAESGTTRSPNLRGPVVSIHETL